VLLDFAQIDQPPQPECCREPGQAKAPEQKGRRPNDLLEAYTGTDTGRKRESHPLKQSSLETTEKHAGGDAVASSEPNTEETGMVRFPETCRGRGAWHVPKALLGTWEAQPTPAAQTTGAKREGKLNDKESLLTESWESDWSIVTRGKAQAVPKRAKRPTPQHRPHRKPEP